MKKHLIIFIVVIFSSNLYAGLFDSLSIGLAGGYTNYSTFRGEVFLKSNLKVFNRNSELKVGMNNRLYHLSFDNVNDLNASSVGLFGDIAIFPFNKGLFTGFRWELINVNWFSDESITKIENESDYEPASVYTGTCLFFQLGYQVDINDRFQLRIFGQPGLQQFKLSNSSIFGSYVITDSPEDIIIENHVEFIYNINLGIVVKIY